MAIVCYRNIILVAIFLGSFMLFTSNGHVENVPATKFGQNVGRPTVSVLYCYSCGYRKAYEDYVQIIGEKYPQIIVTGANYDPSKMSMFISKAIFYTKIILIILIVTSFNSWQSFGIEIPAWWLTLLEHKFYSCLMIFFVGNMLEAQMISSGAFEISINDVPVWSKLQTGRIPSPQELFQIIDNHLQFSGKVDENPDFVK